MQGIATGANPGPIAGPSSLLGVLGALASAVPSYFQGREMALDLQNQQRQQVLQTLPYLINAARMGAPGADAGLANAWKALGLPALGQTGQSQPPGGVPAGQTGQVSAPPVSGQQVPPQGQTMAFQPGAQPFGAGRPAAGMPTGLANLVSAIQGGKTTQVPTQAPAQVRQPAQPRAPVQPSVPTGENPYLAAFGGSALSPDVANALMKLPPSKREGYFYATQGYPAPPGLLESLPFTPDETAVTALRNSIDQQLNSVEGGKLTTAGFRAVIQGAMPQIQDLMGDDAQNFVKSLLDPKITQLTQTAQLNAKTLATKLGLTEAQTQAALSSVTRNIASADWLRTEAQAKPIELEQAAARIGQENVRLGQAAQNIQLRTQELGLRLEGATNPGSYEAAVHDMETYANQLRSQLNTARSLITKRVPTGVKGDFQTMLSWVVGHPQDPIGQQVGSAAQRVQALQAHLDDLDATIQYYQANRGKLIQQFLTTQGAPPYVHVERVNGKEVDEITTMPGFTGRAIHPGQSPFPRRGAPVLTGTSGGRPIYSTDGGKTWKTGQPPQ